MKLFGTFRYERHVPILFRVIELILIVDLFLLSHYGGLFHLGADPPLSDSKSLQQVGAVPWGQDGRSEAFGEFVTSSHLYIFSLLLCADLHWEQAPIVNLLVNIFGSFFFLALAAIQFNAWSGNQEARSAYRDLTGLYPFWRDPTVPRVMGFVAMLIGLLLLVSLGFSVILMTKGVRKKKVRFHQEDEAHVRLEDVKDEELLHEEVGGMSGELRVPGDKK